MVYTDLVMDNGELVRIECPNEFADKMYDTLQNAMKRRDWWSPTQFDGCSAEYMGMNMDKVNMARVIGTL